VLPGGGAALGAFFTVLLIAFFAGIALLGYRAYRDNSLTFDAMEPRTRLVLYGSLALAFLTFTASQRLFGVGAVGVLAWFALLGLCAYGLFWAYLRTRRAS
jgi:hypothetical protein